MAQLRGDPPVELAHGRFWDTDIHRLTEEMGPDWRVWVEKPMDPAEKIGEWYPSPVNTADYKIKYRVPDEARARIDGTPAPIFNPDRAC